MYFNTNRKEIRNNMNNNNQKSLNGFKIKK